MAFVSLSGLDMSFMREPAKKKRGRPRKHPVKQPAKSAYQRQMEEFKARAQAQPSKRAAIACPVLMTDIKPFVSPVDGTEITSRSKLRAHEHKHNIRQCGDFRPGELIAKENKRIEESLRGAEMESISWE